MSSQEEQEFEVERILEKKVEDGQILYKVKWKGYPLDDASWEPEENLQDCKQTIKDFKKAFGIKDYDQDQFLDSFYPKVGAYFRYQQKLEKRQRQKEKRRRKSTKQKGRRSRSRRSREKEEGVKGRSQEKKRKRRSKTRSVIEIYDKQQLTNPEPQKNNICIQLSDSFQEISRSDKIHEKKLRKRSKGKERTEQSPNQTEKDNNPEGEEREQKEEVVQLFVEYPINNIYFQLQRGGKRFVLPRSQVVSKHFLALIQYYQKHLELY